MDFMITEPWTWTPETTIPYLDRANISMQMLSYVRRSLPLLRAANDYGGLVVSKYPSRFGLLLALPTNNPNDCLAEIKRGDDFPIPPDGYALSTVYNDIWLSDPILDPVWNALDSKAAVCHVHPDATAPGAQGRPSPLIEVAFDTARTITDMLYRGIFQRWPNIKFVFAHCGGAMPVLSGRISLLGTEKWCPNPFELTREDLKMQLAGLYVDTAATAKTGMMPAVKMVGLDHVVYGADCGVPCSTEATMEENRRDVIAVEKELIGEMGKVGSNGWDLFPAAAKRVEEAQIFVV